MRAYTRTWLFIDVIWTFPFYLFAVRPDVLALTFPSVHSSHAALSTLEHHSWLYPSLRCLRLLRVISIPRIQRRIEYSLLISSKLSGLSTFVYMVLALSHVFRYSIRVVDGLATLLFDRLWFLLQLRVRVLGVRR